MSASNPVFSVVLPLSPGDPDLDDCLASVLAQSVLSLELLVAIPNDAAREERERRLRAVEDRRLRYYFLPPDWTATQSLNHLAAEARGTFVTLLRTRHRLAKDCLAETQRYFSEYPELAFVMAKSPLVETSFPEVLPPTHVLQRLFYDGPLPGAASVVSVRRSVLDTVGLFDLTFGPVADYELWTRLAFRGGLAVTRRPLVEIHAPLAAEEGRSSGPESVLQKLRVRASLIPLLPGPIQKYARRFEERRHFVEDFHAAIGALLVGRVADFLRIARILGARDFLRAGAFWLVTANNRLWRPTPRYHFPRIGTGSQKRAA